MIIVNVLPGGTYEVSTSNDEHTLVIGDRDELDWVLSCAPVDQCIVYIAEEAFHGNSEAKAACH